MLWPRLDGGCACRTGRCSPVSYTHLDVYKRQGLIKGGMDRLGDVVDFNTVSGGTVKAKVVDPVFYDKDGEKQNV